MHKLSILVGLCALSLGVVAQELPQGALSHTFQVSEDQHVVFAQGNLQYNAAEGTHACADGTTQPGTWRLADNQYDYIGDANANIAANYNGYIDLFAFGTGGWNSGARCYSPWDITPTSSAYFIGGDYSNDLTGAYANADWGVYNAISNAGNQPGLWRTLTGEEWNYLFLHNHWTLAYVGETLSFLLFPTDFVAPAGINIAYVWQADGTTPPNEFDDALWNTNRYTLAQWAELEQAGVLLLPAAGMRNETLVILPNELGYYYSASVYGEENENWAVGPAFGITSANPLSYNERFIGRAIRLVADADAPTALPSTTADPHKAHKIIRNGQVLIVRDGKTFNILGNEQ